jgi:hypothetical protein
MPRAGKLAVPVLLGCLVSVITQSDSSQNHDEAGTLPPNWQEYTDEQTGNLYYHNEKSSETTWERPIGNTSDTIEPSVIEASPMKDPNTRLGDTVCATFVDCMLAKVYCKGPQCIDIEIRL